MQSSATQSSAMHSEASQSIVGEAHDRTATTEEPAEREVPLELLVDLEPRASVPPPKLFYGTVEEGAELRVRTHGLEPEGTRRALRAKSCLVGAEPGDRVLCTTDGDQIVVLAVVSGGAASGAEATTIKVGGKLEIAAEQLTIRAKSALLSLDDLRVFGRSVEAMFGDKATLVAERIESRASQLLQRAKNAFRFTENLDQVRARNVDVRAESLAAVRGENTIVAARVLAKLDGEQVKIG